MPALDHAALKTGSKCSLTKVNSAFSPVFALPDHRSTTFRFESPGQLRTGKPNSLKTNELISKTYGVRRFWNKRMSLSEKQLTRKERGRSLTDEDCHTYLLASMSFTFREKRR
ncbi:hypothetical protein DOZ80_18605 [Pseudomonas fluorescens]|uniref:Uncharacterized protein n=1 Tax=Pseudomonas fluorescens TaxID=294 RepID=A0A327MZI1_PSEFL|nr:hypothetical protein DOZ80_18605 [Pseudomonas fluorescens]